MYNTSNATFFVLQNITASSIGSSYQFNIWLLSLLIVFTAPVNIIIIYLLSHQKKTVNTCGFTTFAISLAVTDTLVGLIILPISLARYVANHWPLEEVSCLLFEILDYGFTSVSIFIMAAMGYDRYKCVTSPMLYRVNFSERRVVVTSVIIWIFGIGAWVPILTIVHVRGDPGRLADICAVENMGFLAIPHAFIMYHLPLIFTITTYVKLVLTLKKRFPLNSATYATNEPQTANQGMEIVHSNISEVGHEQNKPHNSQTAADGKPDVIEIRETSSYSKESGDFPKLSYKYLSPNVNIQNQKCLKTAILVVTSFVVCWGPICLLWPLIHVCENCVRDDIYYAIGSFSYANSTINPFIYLITSVQLRQDFIKLIWRK